MGCVSFHSRVVSLTVLSLDIVFPSQVPSGIGENTIDISALKKLGDEQARLLASDLNLDSGNGGGGGDEDECNADGGRSSSMLCRMVLSFILHRRVDCSGSQVCCIFAEVKLGSFQSCYR